MSQADIIPQLEARIRTLEARLLELTSEIERYRSAIEIDSVDGDIKICSDGKLEIEATSISISASGALQLESSGLTTIQGAMVQIN